MGGITLNVSLMNEKVTFQKNTVTTDSIGNHKNGWEDLYLPCDDWWRGYGKLQGKGRGRSR